MSGRACRQRGAARGTATCRRDIHDREERSDDSQLAHHERDDSAVGFGAAAEELVVQFGVDFGVHVAPLEGVVGTTILLTVGMWRSAVSYIRRLLWCSRTPERTGCRWASRPREAAEPRGCSWCGDVRWV